MPPTIPKDAIVFSSSQTTITSASSPLRLVNFLSDLKPTSAERGVFLQARKDALEIELIGAKTQVAIHTSVQISKTAAVELKGLVDFLYDLMPEV